MRNNAHRACTGRHTTGLRLGVAFSSLLLLSAGSVSAQENLGDDSTVVYPASYFAEYSPVTALDMANRIPGLNISGGNRGPGNASRGGRGLGSGGGGTEVIINGKRTAGKNNSTRDQLDRITAEQVDYIEIIRGTGGGSRYSWQHPDRQYSAV